MFNNDQEQKKTFVKGLVTGVAIVVLLGGIFQLGKQSSGGSLLGGGTKVANTNVQPNTNIQPSQPIEGDASKVAPIDKEDHVRGDSKAAITMIEYSDFECPFCSRFHTTLTQVLNEYKGKVKLVYRHFPLRSIHPVAQKGAEASECASEQGKFWEMHDKLFELKAANTFSLDTIKKAAADLKLNTTQFNSCLDTDKYAARVEKDYQNGLAAGVSGTPGTFINGQYVAGALPYEQIKPIIDSLL